MDFAINRHKSALNHLWLIPCVSLLATFTVSSAYLRGMSYQPVLQLVHLTDSTRGHCSERRQTALQKRGRVTRGTKH